MHATIRTMEPAELACLRIPFEELLEIRKLPKEDCPNLMCFLRFEGQTRLFEQKDQSPC